MTNTRHRPASRPPVDGELPPDIEALTDIIGAIFGGKAHFIGFGDAVRASGPKLSKPSDDMMTAEEIDRILASLIGGADRKPGGHKFVLMVNEFPDAVCSAFMLAVKKDVNRLAYELEQLKSRS